MCISPLNMKNPNGKGMISVPCGKCVECCSKQVNEWTFRLIEQMKGSSSAYFFTLTYDDDNLPLEMKESEFGDVTSRPCFRKSDIQALIHALRDSLRRNLRKRFCAQDVKKIVRALKYFITSEYGDTTYRPHYHGIIFGYPLGFDTFVSELSTFWKKGFVSVSNCNEVRCYYTVKYIFKARNPKLFLDTPFGPLQKPFLVCSKGLGLCFLTQQMKDYMLGGEYGDYNLYIHQGNFKKLIPKYYRDKVFIYDYQKDKLKDFWSSFDEFERCPESADPFRWRFEIYNKKVRKIINKNIKDKL